VALENHGTLAAGRCGGAAAGRCGWRCCGGLEACRRRTLPSAGWSGVRSAEGVDACDDCSMARLDVVGVIVSRLDRAIEFYRRLGLQFPEDPDPLGHGHVEASLPGGLRFTLDTEESIRSFDPAWAPPPGGHRVAVAFRCESPQDVDRLYRELTDAGALGYKEPWDAFWGQRYAQVKDPDGSVIDLFAPLG
jgi:catechol 2,3-dioxygenase-like lactoylglutathione lyase family enzyme